MPSITTGHTPDLDKYLRSLKGLSLDASVESLVSHLKRRQIKGSEPCAIATAHILLQVVAKSKWQDVETLIYNVSKFGRRLVEAQPQEVTIANIIRRVLGLIRDEAAEDRNDPSSETQSEAQAASPTTAVPNSESLAHHWPPSKQESAGDHMTTSPNGPARPGPAPMAGSIHASKSLFHILSASPSAADLTVGAQGSPLATSGTSTPVWRAHSGHASALRSEVIDGIEEIKDEISQVDDLIAAVADVQIHPGDYVLVHQPSSTVERFVLRAAAKRKFTVLLASEPPRKQQVEDKHATFIKKLSAAGVSVINLMNAGLAAYMPRVDKVILGARSVLANGGVLTDTGAAAIARAAKEAGSPVVVLSGIYKLSPENPVNESSLIEWGDSASFVKFADGAMVGNVEVRSALTEFVPSNLVDTYITNLGTHSRDHLSSLIADHYKQEDNDFHIWDDTH